MLLESDADSFLRKMDSSRFADGFAGNKLHD